MCHALEKVLQLALGTFTKSENFKHKLEKLVTQTSQLTGKDVGLENCRTLVTTQPPQSQHSRKPAPVTYIKVVENPVVSIGIFVIREGERIPLHDHPNMHGIIKCLQGRLRISSFQRKDNMLDLVDLPERFRGGDLREKIELGELFIAECHPPIVLTPDSPSCFLTPDRGNIHQVESLNGPAAFLDILSPPYNIDPLPQQHDQEVRDCNYYIEVGEVDENHKWLHHTPPPPSFFCDTEPYQGPALKNPDELR